VKPLANALHGQVFRALGIHDFLQIACRLVERQRRIQIARQTLREPGIKQLVPSPESDRARPDHRHDLTFAIRRRSSSQKVSSSPPFISPPRAGKV
jgi:hypothetical protein